MNVVIILIEHNNQILIGKKIDKPGHEFSGAWHVPGGTVNAEEEIDKAVVREAKEETGLIVEVEKQLGSFMYEGNHLYVFLTKPTNGISSLNAGDDLSEVKFVEKSEILELYGKQKQRDWPKETLDYLHS